MYKMKKKKKYMNWIYFSMFILIEKLSNIKLFV